MTDSSFSAAEQGSLPAGCSSLLSAAGVEQQFGLKQIVRGANNRVFRVDADGRRLLLKWYFLHPDDPRDRLFAEYSFAHFAWQNGIHSLPQPLGASPEDSLGLYEFIDGQQLSSNEITGRHIEAALDFYERLNRHKGHADAAKLRNASEACFSIRDHLKCVENRINILREIDHTAAVHSDAVRFVEHELMPAWNDALELLYSSARRWKLSLDSQLAHEDRCLSPSDFGFHNAIQDECGKIRFFDFEYAGWDDPAKLVCDFFCQVEVPVPREYFVDFTKSVAELQQRPEELQQRIRLLFPIYQLKWCCILLNEFLPASSARRQFSQGAGDINCRKEEQLIKARRALVSLAGSPPSLHLRVAKRKVVVIGANSFSGQDFVDLLLDDTDNEVLGISRSPERSALFLSYKLRKNPQAYRYFQMDLNQQMPELLQLLDSERPEYIVNFAAQSEVAPSWEYPEQWFQTNCVALARLANHLRRRDYLKRFLHISSPEVYGTCIGRVDENAPMNPSTPYAASKAASDILLQTYRRQYGFPLLTVRSTNVYGARQQLFKIIPRSVIYVRLGRKIPLHGGGRAVKSYIHIRDISRGELAVLEHGQMGQIYHLSPDYGIAVRDIVHRIGTRMGQCFEDVANVVDERPGQDAAYVIDSSRARTELGWTPDVSFDDGLSGVIEWIDRNWTQIATQPLEYQHKP